jgi:hypothetical protein
MPVRKGDAPMLRPTLFLSAAMALSAAGCGGGPLGALGRADDDDEGEVHVKLEDCPQSVRDTIRKEAGTGSIEEIEKETEKGKTVYEAEVLIAGKTYELTVGEDGKLISKEAEDDEDDDDGED